MVGMRSRLHRLKLPGLKRLHAAWLAVLITAIAAFMVGGLVVYARRQREEVA